MANSERIVTERKTMSEPVGFMVEAERSFISKILKLSTVQTIFAQNKYD
jgi:hypothetical protein